MVCLDLEGVLVPEVWINFADRSGISALRRTTRDEPDYDLLMRYRLDILDREGLKLPDITAVIDDLGPLDGARAFLDSLRETYQVVILSDTFQEFARPLMRQLGWPTLFCHGLDVDIDGRVAGYRLRMRDHKRAAVAAFRSLNMRTVAAGDSYNDTTMLGEADVGLLFRAPDNVIAEFPQYRAVAAYADLRAEIDAAFERLA